MSSAYTVNASAGNVDVALAKASKWSCTPC